MVTVQKGYIFIIIIIIIIIINLSSSCLPKPVKFTARLFNKTCHMNMCITGQPDLTDEEPKFSARDRCITLQSLQSSPERVRGKAEYYVRLLKGSSFGLLLISGQSTNTNLKPK